jgi:hypothetical protein
VIGDGSVIKLIIDYCHPSPVLMQDGDEASPVLTSCDIVKVPDPQMCMVRTHSHQTHNVRYFKWSQTLLIKYILGKRIKSPQSHHRNMVMDMAWIKYS